MKETFYFTHDYNARSDEKIKLLIRKFGMTGYGIYWSIVEDLYQNANALRTDCEGIAFDLRTDKNIVESILNDFDLFVMDNDFFGSKSIEMRLNERNQKSLKAKESANYRWSKIKENANALRNECDRNAIKEKKVKESKIKEKKPIKTSTEVSSDYENIKIYLLKHFDEKYVTPENIKIIEKLKKTYTALIIDKAIKWGRGDPFWSGNFLSPAKLAKKNKDGVLFIDVFLEKLKNESNGNEKPKFTNTANRIDEPAYLQSLAERLQPKQDF